MDITRIKTALSRLMRKKWVWFLLVIAGFWTSSHVWDYYKLLSGQTPMYDVAIKLKVGDELVEINRTVPCLEIPRGEPLQYLFKKRPFTYRARDLSTGAHLEDGRAVLSIIPDVCREIKDAMDAGETGDIAPSDFLPMTALMDDFDDPQLMKVFGARSYYARNDAEVKVLSYDIRPAEKGSFPSLKDEFGWFRGGTVYKRSNDYLFFDSAKIICRPLDVYPGWWGGPADAFDNVTEPAFAYDVTGFGGYGPFTVPFSGAGRPFFGNIDRNVPVISEPHARHISLDHVIPAVKEDGVYRFDAKNKGVLLLRHTDGERQPEEVTKTGNRKITVRKAEIEVGDKTIALIDETIKEGSWRKGKSSYYFFDPSVESICSLSIEHIRFLDTR